jgi:hypothetical protein
MHHLRLVIFSQSLQAIQHFVPRARPGEIVGAQVVYVGWALDVHRCRDRMRGGIGGFGGGVLGVLGYHHHCRIGRQTAVVGEGGGVGFGVGDVEVGVGFGFVSEFVGVGIVGVVPGSD